MIRRASGWCLFLPPAPAPSPTPSPTSSGASHTLSFTQGVDGYAGVEDASISNMYYSSSNPKGTTFETNDQLYVYEINYAAKGLIRFDVSAIPSTAHVVSASLDLTIESWTSPQTVIGAFVTTPWDYSSSSFGWTNAGAGAAWSVPGVGFSDIHAPGFQFSDITANGFQRMSVALDAASVEAWVKDDASNQGLILTNPNQGKLLRIYSSEASNTAQRPTLSVTYL